jgi:hypothetical protein
MIAITTIDNPYDPLDDFMNWFLFDSVHNYNTCAWLARFTNTTEMFSEFENKLEIEHGIDELIKVNPTFYKKVVHD